MNQRIGILSGTFDPIHDGHVQFALQAITKAQLDRVYLMVERSPRRKQGIKAFEHRQAMVQLALDDEPMIGSIITDQDRFTAQETLPILQNRFAGADLVLLMGDDMLAHLNEWPHVETLLASVEFVIGVRNNMAEAEARLQNIQETRSITFAYQLFESQKDTVSSSMMRQKIRANTTPRHLHPEVVAYIQQEGLYASED